MLTTILLIKLGLPLKTIQACREGFQNVPRSLDSLVCTSGCTVGPKLPSGLGRLGCAFVVAVGLGGVRVGYFRAVFVAAAGSFDAAFEALDAEEPISVDSNHEFEEDEG